MRPAHIVEIVTPKKFRLNGLWFGPRRPRQAIIWIHGLSSSAFSKLDIVANLADTHTAVLTFNNRGHSNVVRIGHLSGKSIIGGAAFERFEDCVDDIDGAIQFAKKAGAKRIFLAGHSTGCQKAIYWAHKKVKDRNVKGIILLAPMSDYAGMVKKYSLPKMRYMQSIAKAMLKSGKTGEFVRSNFWQDEPNTARRFLSLYTPDSTEQSIFSYFDPSRRARILSTAKLPLLNILAEKDEYADRPVHEIARWFEQRGPARLTSVVVKGANHSFKTKEREVVRIIRYWIRKLK
jgi:alpha-beta hydrolase superfamily lysophospholipase